MSFLDTPGMIWDTAFCTPSLQSREGDQEREFMRVEKGNEIKGGMELKEVIPS